MMRVLVYSIFILLAVSCSTESNNHQLGERFFEIYSKRAEIDKMLSFYADEFEYENIGFSSSTNDPKFLYEDFYGWKNPAIKYESENSITVTEILSNKYSIVAKGYTMPYLYNGNYVEGNRFVIWLELDDNSRIIKQTDWFDYPMSEIIEAYQLKQSISID